MIAPVDLSSKNLSLAIVDASNITHTQVLTSKNFQKGKAYLLNTTFNSKLVNGHECVNLGLPSGVKWATCNVGAESPSGYGSYFAWGETTAKYNFTHASSKFDGVPYSSLKGQGVIDEDDNLTSEYDAATVNWGDKWRMPTYDELDELLTKCTFALGTQDGVSGYLVTGPNGNSIFLPFAGYRYGTNKYDIGTWSRLWCATYREYSADAWCLWLCNSIKEISWDGVEQGEPIRPVTK